VIVGFDQYHEPPDELRGETRTFARLCASLTEEAEEEAVEGAASRGAPVAGGGSLGIGSLSGLDA
jgi:hypothetical protein